VIISQGGVGELYIFPLVMRGASDQYPVPHIAPELLPMKSKKHKGDLDASQEL
jgi:hypothetical protein